MPKMNSRSLVPNLPRINICRLTFYRMKNNFHKLGFLGQLRCSSVRKPDRKGLTIAPNGGILFISNGL